MEVRKPISVPLTRHLRSIGAGRSASFTHSILVASSASVAGGISVGAIVPRGYNGHGIAVVSILIFSNAAVDVDFS